MSLVIKALEYYIQEKLRLKRLIRGNLINYQRMKLWNMRQYMKSLGKEKKQ